MRCSWNDTSEILVVVASPMQKSEKRSDVRDRRRAGGRRRRERQLMLDGGKNLLRCQSLEVLAGVVMADPDQKAPSAQKDAIAGLGLKTPHPAQIIGKGGQERGVWIIDHTGCGNNESFGRHSPRVLKC
jgi:hypothetical protein